MLKNQQKMSNGVNLLKIIKEYIHNRPRIKKMVGIILILVGLAALFTPLIPGSWLAIIGLELLGIRILFFDKFKFCPPKADPPSAEKKK